ncbi:MAG TPA: FtsH protease activity modulator HflK [Clostridiales bacterium]|nr:FtsH protease activity modulator HflK [Clostridiales bacterium]
MEEKNIYDFPSGDKFRGYFKNFGRIVFLVILLVFAAVIVFGSFYTIEEQEKAVVTTFGKAKTVGTAGLHFKIPLIQMVQKVDTTIQGFPIGYDAMTDGFIETESMMITRDFNFVNVDFFVEYKVSDPVKWLYASDQPVTILKNVAQSSIRMVVGSYDVDNVITTGKNEIQSVIKETIINKLAVQDIGIQLVNITIQDAEPPTETVMEAFKAVETAKQGKETALNNASKYRNEKLPQAEAEVDKILQKAQSTRAERVNEAESEVARFNEMYEEYTKYPLITKERMFYETMESVLPSLKVIIDSGSSGVQKLLPIEPLVGQQEVE